MAKRMSARLTPLDGVRYVLTRIIKQRLAVTVAMSKRSSVKLTAVAIVGYVAPKPASENTRTGEAGTGVVVASAQRSNKITPAFGATAGRLGLKMATVSDEIACDAPSLVP